MIAQLDDLRFRLARRSDVVAIRAMLADDELGATREDLSDAGLERYLAVFGEIERDPRNELTVATIGDRLVGTYQVTYIPYLSRGGNERALVEAVRVASDFRGAGIGGAMMEFAISKARQRGCQLMQLTTDVARSDARRFYERLGFIATHHGMKLAL
ncbi:MAG: GNAT family N-acetyltransferase [Fimbriimonadaceae bacterium]|nr:GNAT family N-acetyltransferase [Alphaproteobacteria bacterium]